MDFAMNEKMPEQGAEPAQPAPDNANMSFPPELSMAPEAIVAVDVPGCRNCGAFAPGRFCPECGQKTDTSIPTLIEFLGDFVQELFNYDSRIWRTIGVLLFRPGRLTLAWLAGQRARYVAPMRLYLATSIVMFLVVSLPDRNDVTVDAGSSFSDVESDVEVDVEVDVDPDPNPTVDQAVQAIIEQGASPDAPALPSAEDGPDPDLCGPSFNWLDDDSEVGKEIQATCARAATDPASRTAIWQSLTDNLPLMAFLIIPIMAAFFKLLYPTTGRAYLEHLAFLTHNHAFTFHFTTINELFKRIDDFVPALELPVQVITLVLPFIYMPVYFFKSLRNVYQQHFLLTLVKFPVLMVVYAIVVAWVFVTGLFVSLLAA